MEVRCVLQVEDDDNDVFLLQYAFKEAQVAMPLVPVKDAEGAMDYLKGSGAFVERAKFPPPALVLLDLKLPRKSGLEVLQWLREQPELRELPVVVLTSSSRPEDIRAAFRLGANAYLVKPSDLQELISVVRCLSEFWLRRCRLPGLAEL